MIFFFMNCDSPQNFQFLGADRLFLWEDACSLGIVR